MLYQGPSSRLYADTSSFSGTKKLNRRCRIAANSPVRAAAITVIPEKRPESAIPPSNRYAMIQIGQLHSFEANRRLAPGQSLRVGLDQSSSSACRRPVVCRVRLRWARRNSSIPHHWTAVITGLRLLDRSRSRSVSRSGAERQQLLTYDAVRTEDGLVTDAQVRRQHLSNPLLRRRQ
jgi:hypothetical protein